MTTTNTTTLTPDLAAARIPYTPPMKGWRDPVYLALLDAHWRPAPPFPGAVGHTIGENGQDHPHYPAAVRREARLRRDTAGTPATESERAA